MAVLPINSTLLYTGRSGLKKITGEIFYKKKGFPHLLVRFSIKKGFSSPAALRSSEHLNLTETKVLSVGTVISISFYCLVQLL